MFLGLNLFLNLATNLVETAPTSFFFLFGNIEVADDVGVLIIFPIRIPSPSDSPIFTKSIKVIWTADTIVV